MAARGLALRAHRGEQDPDAQYAVGARTEQRIRKDPAVVGLARLGGQGATILQLIGGVENHLGDSEVVRATIRAELECAGEPVVVGVGAPIGGGDTGVEVRALLAHRGDVADLLGHATGCIRAGQFGGESGDGRQVIRGGRSGVIGQAGIDGLQLIDDPLGQGDAGDGGPEAVEQAAGGAGQRRRDGSRVDLRRSGVEPAVVRG